MTIRRISPADRGTLAEVLAKAFEHDPVLRWIIPANEHYQRIAIPYFSLLLHQSMSFGASYTNEDQTGVALWVGPSESPSAFSHLAGTCRLLWLLKGNILRAYRLQELMASYRPRKDFLHLTHIELARGLLSRCWKKPKRSHCRSIWNAPIKTTSASIVNLGFV
jgi:hypothetical protein